MDATTQPRVKGAKEGEVERVYRLIKDWLIHCKLPPGECLSEVELARQCQTSRTPIREACSRLAQDGWISRVRHKGYIVKPVSIRDLLQIYEYRKMLECFAVEKATQIGTAEQLDALAGIIGIEQQPGADVRDIVSASDRFHLAIAEIAGNQRVINQLKLTLEYVHRLDILSTQQDGSWIPHGEILNAMQCRKSSEAQKMMAQHIECARDRMLRLFAT